MTGGEPDENGVERMQKAGYQVSVLTGHEPLPELLYTVCTEVHAVYLCPLWRSSTTARAVRAAAVAAGVKVLGFA